MDYGLAHYYNREERDMNFLQSMTTANFWSNDFLSGLAFTVGAMLSSAVYSGAGLMNLARTGARAGVALARIGKAASDTKKAFGAYLRAAPYRTEGRQGDWTPPPFLARPPHGRHLSRPEVC